MELESSNRPAWKEQWMFVDRKIETYERVHCRKPFLDTNGHEFPRIVSTPREKIRANLCEFVSGSLFAVES
jgi:hypothetical protein